MSPPKPSKGEKFSNPYHSVILCLTLSLVKKTICESKVKAEISEFHRWKKVTQKFLVSPIESTKSFVSRTGVEIHMENPPVQRKRDKTYFLAAHVIYSQIIKLSHRSHGNSNFY